LLTLDKDFLYFLKDQKVVGGFFSLCETLLDKYLQPPPVRDHLVLIEKHLFNKNIYK